MGPVTYLFANPCRVIRIYSGFSVIRTNMDTSLRIIISIVLRIAWAFFNAC